MTKIKGWEKIRKDPRKLIWRHGDDKNGTGVQVYRSALTDKWGYMWYRYKNGVIYEDGHQEPKTKAEGLKKAMNFMRKHPKG